MSARVDPTQVRCAIEGNPCSRWILLVYLAAGLCLGARADYQVKPLTEAQAKEKGYEVRTGSFPFSANPRARIMQEAEGLIKIVADAKYDEVLGVHIIGPKATELILEGGMALALESTVEEIIHTIHAHPTLGEALGEAAHAVHGQALHI